MVSFLPYKQEYNAFYAKFAQETVESLLKNTVFCALLF